MREKICLTCTKVQVLVMARRRPAPPLESRPGAGPMREGSVLVALRRWPADAARIAPLAGLTEPSPIIAGWSVNRPTGQLVSDGAGGIRKRSAAHRHAGQCHLWVHS